MWQKVVDYIATRTLVDLLWALAFLGGVAFAYVVVSIHAYRIRKADERHTGRKPNADD